MPISGFKPGDRVITPSGKEGQVWKTVGLLAIVRVGRQYISFRQAALRLDQRKEA